jgi:putative phosphoribosyl transferase
MQSMHGRLINTAKHMKMSRHPNVAPPPREDEMEMGAESVTLQIPAGEVTLTGDLEIPENPRGLVLFAHGSGSSRSSPRNQAVAEVLRDAGMATLLFDLLTPHEEVEDAYTGHLRFDIGLLSRRLAIVTNEIARDSRSRRLGIGYFGASTGGAAALRAAAALGSTIGAVVSRGGRPDLAGEALLHVQAPTLLIVGGRDEEVLQLNEQAYEKLQCEKSLVVVPHATHLFQEPGALEEVAQLAANWFHQHLEPRK